MNFFVDQVGQYIAENVKLMTELDTIAESLNTKCKGQAWVIVTSQQDMEAIIGDGKAFQSQDFEDHGALRREDAALNPAYVQRSSSVAFYPIPDEGQVRLGNLHDREENNLKTLFDFTDGSIKLKNFDGRAHFVSSYPFPPYQYMLFQMAIKRCLSTTLSRASTASVGERSMPACSRRSPKRWRTSLWATLLRSILCSRASAPP